MKKIALSLGLSLTLLSGCTSMAHNDSVQANTLQVEFVGQGSYHITPQQGTVSLYAVDSQIADVSATLIQQQKVQVSQVPFTVLFTIAADHRQRIQPPVRDDAKITYYVTWQSDTKNLTGKDSIVIDYDRKFPRVVLDAEKQKIYLKTNK